MCQDKRMRDGQNATQNIKEQHRIEEETKEEEKQQEMERERDGTNAKGILKHLPLDNVIIISNTLPAHLNKY